jgi:NADP-dependent 3-hydroxy acid dehydrogenase YdfG
LDLFYIIVTFLLIGHHWLRYFAYAACLLWEQKSTGQDHSNKMRLQDKKVIVTGAGQGIGRAIALKMAKEGADVVIAELSSQTGAQTKQEVEDQGRKALHIPVDVADQKQVQAMIDQVLRTWKRIDILVNNAGFDEQPS